LSESATENLKIINKYIYLYKLLLQKIIMNINYNNIESKIIQESINSLEVIYNKLNYKLVDKSNLSLFEILITQFYEKIEDITLFIEITKYLLKKHLKNPKINLMEYENKWNAEMIDAKLKESPEKIIKWILS
jgi:hypothetical protein